MGRLEFATPREAWGGEATAFTPLLAQEELLAYLGAETGLGSLSLIETEHTTAGVRSLDILAQLPSGDRVAIENQYGQADHDHLTRGLAYAVATGSRALVVVAEDHRDEFVSVANYLNDIAGQSEAGIGVWLVKVRATRRVGDAVWSPEFVVQAEPNEWEAKVRRETPPTLVSLEEFYERCAERVDASWAASARVIIEEWIDRPGASEDHNTQRQVALYLARTGSRPGTNVLQLTTGGDLVICRGNIWRSSGVFDPSIPPEALDEQISDVFPDARWTPKAFYLTNRDPDPGAVSRFADWLVGAFGEGAGE